MVKSVMLILFRILGIHQMTDTFASANANKMRGAEAMNGGPPPHYEQAIHRRVCLELFGGARRRQQQSDLEGEPYDKYLTCFHVIYRKSNPIFTPK